MNEHSYRSAGPSHAMEDFCGAMTHTIEPLTIAIVNNSSDAALSATEKYLCNLIGAASSGLTVRLKFYALPSMRRGEDAVRHIDNFYESFEDLEQETPCGLIVTGTEPRSDSLKDEAFWPDMARLIEWVEDRGIPTIWSCLAAHAAVLHMDGVERRLLPKKLSGVFECRINARAHDVLYRMPARWRVPHSRRYGLDARQLEAHGYTILSRSRDVGVDIFVRETSGFQLFLQGHPEYEAATLLTEYCRDVRRAARKSGHALPDFPVGLTGPDGRPPRLDGIHAQLSAGEDRLNAQIDRLAADVKPMNCWAEDAQRLFMNWLSILEVQRKDAGRLKHDSMFHDRFSVAGTEVSLEAG